MLLTDRGFWLKFEQIRHFLIVVLAKRDLRYEDSTVLESLEAKSLCNIERGLLLNAYMRWDF